MQYFQVLISAEQRTQATRILDRLTAKQLVLGGPILNGPAKFLWNFEDSAVPQEMRENKLYVVEHDYCFIVTYTREDLKEELIREAEDASLEQVCMISFLPMEGNAALVALLENVFKARGTGLVPEPVDATAATTFVPSKEIPARTVSSF
jgi:hypothetical protein